MAVVIKWSIVCILDIAIYINIIINVRYSNCIIANSKRSIPVYPYKRRSFVICRIYDCRVLFKRYCFFAQTKEALRHTFKIKIEFSWPVKRANFRIKIWSYKSHSEFFRMICIFEPLISDIRHQKSPKIIKILCKIPVNEAWIRDRYIVISPVIHC